MKSTLLSFGKRRVGYGYGGDDGRCRCGRYGCSENDGTIAAMATNAALGVVAKYYAITVIGVGEAGARAAAVAASAHQPIGTSHFDAQNVRRIRPIRGRFVRVRAIGRDIVCARQRVDAITANASTAVTVGIIVSLPDYIIFLCETDVRYCFAVRKHTRAFP